MGFVKSVGQSIGLIQPDAPDQSAIIAAQAAANSAQQQQNLFNNRVTQVGPEGTVSWGTGADGRPMQTTQLSAGNQALYDQQQKLSTALGKAGDTSLAQVQSALAKPMETTGLPTLSGGPGAVNDATRKRVEEALYSRLEPQYQKDEAALRSRLLNSGIEVGSAAYNNEMNNFSQRLNDARMQAVAQGGAEESRQYQMGLAGAQFGNAARSQGLTEQTILRQQPLSELNALRTGSQPGTPQFGNYYTNGMAAPDALGASSEATKNANAQSKQMGSMFGKVGSFFLGG